MSSSADGPRTGGPPLAHRRGIDQTGLRGGLAGRSLADLGADAVNAVARAGDPGRPMPWGPFVEVRDRAHVLVENVGMTRAAARRLTDERVCR